MGRVVETAQIWPARLGAITHRMPPVTMAPSASAWCPLPAHRTSSQVSAGLRKRRRTSRPPLRSRSSGPVTTLLTTHRLSPRSAELSRSSCTPDLQARHNTAVMPRRPRGAAGPMLMSTRSPMLSSAQAWARPGERSTELCTRSLVVSSTRRAVAERPYASARKSCAMAHGMTPNGYYSIALHLCVAKGERSSRAAMCLAGRVCGPTATATEGRSVRGPATTCRQRTGSS